MKQVKEFGIILAFSFAGEILHAVLPLPVPASIYGIVLLFTALQTGRLKLEAVEGTGKFLVGIMPLMFIPAAVGLMESWEMLRPALGQYAVILVVSTVLVMGLTGRLTQAVLRRSGKEEGR